MAEYLKVLAQVNPTANVLTDAYVVPANRSAAVSSIIICNVNPLTFCQFSISIAVNGAADTLKQYLYYLVPVDINDCFIATIGLSLAQNDVIRVLSTDGSTSFNIAGIEIY